MEPEEYLDKAAAFSDEIEDPYPEQKRMARILFESMKIQGVVQVSQGPTGMGKTLVQVSVAKALVDLGKRVLIAVPTYNHLNDNTIRELEWIDVDRPSIIYGISNKRYTDVKCPLGRSYCHRNPISKTCQEQIESCPIAKERGEATKGSLALTVHHMIASKPTIMNDFDVILIDESHGLPEVIRGQAEKTITPNALNKFFQTYKDAVDLDHAQKLMKRAQRQLQRDKRPPRSWADDILSNLRETAREHPNNENFAEWRYYDFAEWASDGTLHFRQHRKKIQVPDHLSVGLISATIEEPRAHVKDCEFANLILRPPDVYDTPEFRRRFEHRPIFGIKDGPRLGKADPKNYATFRDEANRIIHELVTEIKEVTLILCQNKRDARSIASALEQDITLKNRLTMLDDEQFEELDSFEDYIQAEIDTGKRLIVATASSRLWEGANVPKLHFLIIDALPYRRASSLEQRATKGRQRAQSWKAWRRFMLTRIQQGVGRLVRKKDEWGIAVIIDGRFHSNHKQFFRELPLYITSPQIFRWTERKKARQDIQRMIGFLRRGKSGRRDKLLDELLGEQVAVS
ncbi:MAG: helicase C-terminal domain-containing protein [Candidatus Heimdallarchaeota archaeon]